MMRVNSVVISGTVRAPYAGRMTVIDPPRETARLVTVPNLITLARLLCLPLFLYLLFERDNRAAAAWLLGGLGATDWIDGYAARRLGQVSEFGKKFDPTVDRLLFIVATLAIIVDGAAPIWFCVLVMVRELLVGLTVAIATLVFGMARFDVSWWGKLATFLLMFALPGFMLGSSDFPGHEWFQAGAWLLGIPGLVISWVTAVAYMPKIRAAVAAGRAARPV
jgi:cardiolipin synthase